MPIGQTDIRIEGFCKYRDRRVNRRVASSRRLSPKARFTSVSLRTSFWILSLLVGWWTYCLIVGGNLGPAPELLLLLGLFGAMFRIVLWLNGLGPSFTFRSRFIYGRLIVPGFDAGIFRAIAGNCRGHLRWHGYPSFRIKVPGGTVDIYRRDLVYPV